MQRMAAMFRTFLTGVVIACVLTQSTAAMAAYVGSSGPYALTSGAKVIGGPKTFSNAMVASTSLTIGSSGTAILQITAYSVAITPTSVSANTTNEQTFTINGLSVNDTILANIGSATPNFCGLLGLRVSGANTAALTYGDYGTAAKTPTASTYQFLAIRS